MTNMGIVSTGTWFPETYITAGEIARQSGMPEWVVREKLGIERKFVADPEVHPNQMAVKAARIAIEKAHIDPMEIDVFQFESAASGHPYFNLHPFHHVPRTI